MALLTPRTMNGTATSREPRLSQVARHVVAPVGIVSTSWPMVRDTLANLGISFDQWQQDLAKLALGKSRQGKWAATVGGVVLSIPRQVGKTFFVGCVVFALCLLNPRQKVVWTAHHTDTSDETFAAMKELAGMSRFRPHVRKVLTGGGKQRIVFQNGSRIEFGARESGFGRGKTKVSILVLDEFQHVSESALENLTPTANQGENPLIFMMGTPPRPVDRGEAFKNKRARALSGLAKNLVYVEMSADQGADVDDRRQWAKANPSYPKRTNDESMLRMRENLASEASFRREALGIWDDAGLVKSTISAEAWDLLSIPADERPSGDLVVGVKFSVDGAFVGLSVAVRPSEVGVPVHVSGLRLASTGEGLGWIVSWCWERRGRIAQIIIDGKGSDQVLIKALLDAGFKALTANKDRAKHFIVTLPFPEYVAAMETTLRAVEAEDLTHSGDELLAGQVAGAVRKARGPSGGWGWAPVSDGGDVTLLDSACLAVYGATTCTRRVPTGKGARIG